MSSSIQLSDHFTFGKLLRFTIPSMVMMIFTSIYSVVDGIFVSNFAGKMPFAALNFIFPFLMFLAIIGFMLGSGGSALIGKLLGEGRQEKAQKVFSLLVCSGAVIGLCFAIAGGLLLPKITVWLGATEALVDDCVIYGRILLVALPFFILQMMFQSLLVTAERPRLGLLVTIISGLLNMLLDYLLIAVFGFGLKGAAWATAISQMVGGLIPLIYFMSPNSSLLQLVRPEWDGWALKQSCFNGISEFFSNISATVVTMLYNYQLIRYIGEDGVAAYGVIMYLSFIFVAIFIGYSMGSAPIVSFHYGADNKNELKNLFGKSHILITIFGISLFLIAELLARPLSAIFVSYDEELLNLTIRAMRIYSISFLLTGYNMYASSFFTALNNGVVSAVIATSRTLICETLAVLLLPAIFGVNGIWFAIIFAEGMALLLSLSLLLKYRKKYGFA
ncbi:MAG: polysaccharide biosynthesis C-terminal domain-containing protein [Bacteroidales bacterium]|nr:polysaccharide biosynthesis C-terminal domain-containing protein [Bacteroidales bacterium]